MGGCQLRQWAASKESMQHTYTSYLPTPKEKKGRQTRVHNVDIDVWRHDTRTVLYVGPAQGNENVWLCAQLTTCLRDLKPHRECEQLRHCHMKTVEPRPAKSRPRIAAGLLSTAQTPDSKVNPDSA